METQERSRADRSSAEYRYDGAARWEDGSDWRRCGKNGTKSGEKQTSQARRADKEKTGARQTEKERILREPSMNH